MNPRSIIFECTTRCNHACAYCYNVWLGGEYPQVGVPPRPYPLQEGTTGGLGCDRVDCGEHGELDTDETQEIVRRAIDGSECEAFTFTGGEPLLRRDLDVLVACADERDVQTNVITNGSLLTPERIASLMAAGVDVFQISLPSADRGVFEQITGSPHFDRVTEAIVDVQLAGANAAVVVVVGKPNLHALRETLEMACALGVSGVMLNRVNIGGRGIAQREELLLTRDMLAEMLEVANQAAEELGLTVASAIPIPPCVLDTSRFDHVQFSQCPAGSDMTYVTVDPVGNVRTCNHSPLVIGNLLHEPLADILSKPSSLDLFAHRPKRCAKCKHWDDCHAGCRAAALVTYGTLDALDPILDARRA